MYLILDIFFTILHILVIGFNLLGWIWKRTRTAHLLLCIITLGSWLILGIWYGLGYCPLTDWHWAIKEKRGITNLPNSFVKWMADVVTGKDIDAGLIDLVTGSLLLFSIIAAFYVNFLLPKRKKRKSNSSFQ